MFIELKKENEFEGLIKEGVTLVDINATWCGPCRMLKPVIEELALEMTNVKFLGVDVDEFSQIAAKFGVRAVPTLLLFKDGTLITTPSGYRPKESLKEFINSHI